MKSIPAAAFSLAILFASTFFSTLVYAQCTKDTECKGNRICDKGICTDPAKKSITSPIALPNAASVADAALRVGEALQDQLKCESPPEPGKAMRAMRSLGFIGIKPVAAVDGQNYYSVLKPLTVFGFTALQVTGWEDSSDRSLFWRGPGTAPPLNIEVTVAGSLTEVTRAMENHLGKPINRRRLSLGENQAPKSTVILCTF